MIDWEAFRCPREAGSAQEPSQARPAKRPRPASPVRGAFVSPETGWRERFTTVSGVEFEAKRPAEAPELPLRLLLVGHNPSEHSWASGTSYSNPSNRFWPTIRAAGLLPPDWRPQADRHQIANLMAGELGIGITDVLTVALGGPSCQSWVQVPGSDAQQFGRRQMLRARPEFYRRLAGHARRAGAPPRLVLFVGKRQFGHLFDPPLKRVKAGQQELLPPGWPYDSGRCAVWVCTSPSGRAVIPEEERLEEYRRLAKALHSIQWPLDVSITSITCSPSDERGNVPGD